VEFEWDERKNELVKTERKVSFKELAEAMDGEGGLLDILENPSYPNQWRYIVRLEKSVWVVVIEEKGRVLRIVTAWPDRKMRKIYGT